MKHCPGCKAVKSLDSFARNQRKPDGLQVYCRECKKGYDTAWYQANKASHKAAVRKARRDIGFRIYEYKLSHPCVDCGFSDPVALDFDHIRDKSYNIHQMVAKGFPWPVILAEIQKCEIRCANCHRVRTASTREYHQYAHVTGKACCPPS